MRKAKNIFANIDTISIALYLLLVFIGWINIYASQYNEDMAFILNLESRYGKQLLFIIISNIIGFVILIIDWKFFFSLSYLFYFFIIILLIGVLLIGDLTGGATSWYKISGFKFQPSEFAKFITALALAKYYNSIHAKKLSLQQKIKTYLLIILPFLLIILQNDLGTGLVFLSFLIVLYREGFSQKILVIGLIMIILFIFSLLIDINYLIYTIILLASFFVFFYRKKKKGIILIISTLIISISFIKSVNYIFHNILEDHHQKRINVLLGKEFDPHGAGYNLIQSKIAIGSGGIKGKGFLNGTQTRFDFVPEQSTDFIFCTIGEEWGFLGSLLFILLFIGLLIRIVFIAERQRSNFSRIYGYSVAAILFIHFTINIGMTIGLLPVIGIPLPFISYGGSSLLGFTILLFIFLNLDSYRLQILR
tara:strand:+ start:104 stop:1366 length:1263 start_codon:yes stop_codon:yes gene_type:complete